MGAPPITLGPKAAYFAGEAGWWWTMIPIARRLPRFTPDSMGDGAQFFYNFAVQQLQLALREEANG